MTKNMIIAEHIVVTFFEAAIAYVIVIPQTNWGKTALAGAIGAGLSAAYNVLRQAEPTLSTPTLAVTSAPVVVAPVVPAEPVDTTPVV